MLDTSLQCNSFKIEETVKWFHHFYIHCKYECMAGSFSNLGIAILSILSSDRTLLLHGKGAFTNHISDS